MTFFDSYTLHGGASITIQNESIIFSREGLATYAGYRLSSDGLVYRQGPNSSWQSLGYYWIDPQSEIANYDVRATLVSGDTPSGTVGSWVNLASTRSWTVAAIVAGNLAGCELTVEIRHAVTLEIKDTATIILEAENFI